MPWMTPIDAALIARLPDYDPIVDAAAIEGLIAEAEALVQAEVGVVEEPDAPEARIFYGVGTAYLRVGPHVGTLTSSDLAIASGFSVPAFVDRGEYLVITDTEGDLLDSAWVFGTWPTGIRVTVTGAWGSDPVPADLLTACRELVVAWFLMGRVSQVSDVATLREMPPLAARAIRRYQMRGGLRRAFA